MTDNQILDLYKKATDENLHFLDLTLSRVRFFLGLVTAIVAGTVTGLFKAIYWYQILLMSTGPILIFYISSITNDGMMHIYRLFLESVTIRFKLAQKLGLTINNENTELKSIWKNEPILPTRYIPDEKKFNSSADWIDDAMKKLPSLWFSRIFRATRILVALLLFIIGLLAYLSYTNEANKTLHTNKIPSGILLVK